MLKGIPKNTWSCYAEMPRHDLKKVLGDVLQNNCKIFCKNAGRCSQKLLMCGLLKHCEVFRKNTEMYWKVQETQVQKCRNTGKYSANMHWSMFYKIAERSSSFWSKMSNLLVKIQTLDCFLLHRGSLFREIQK